MPKIRTILTALIATFVTVAVLSRIPAARKFMLNE
jgi:hypothetical protein